MSSFSFSFPSQPTCTTNATTPSFSFAPSAFSSSTTTTRPFQFPVVNNLNSQGPAFAFDFPSFSASAFAPLSSTTTVQNPVDQTDFLEQLRKQEDKNSALQEKIKELEAENANLNNQIQSYVTNIGNLTAERNSLASRISELTQNQGIVALADLKLESKKQYETLIAELLQLQNSLLTEQDSATKQDLILQRNQKRRDIISCIEKIGKDAQDQLLPYAQQLVSEWLDIKLHHFSPIKAQLESDIAMEDELKEIITTPTTSFQYQLEVKEIEKQLYQKLLEGNPNDKKLQESLETLNIAIEQLKARKMKQTGIAVLGAKRTNPLFGFPELQSGIMSSLEQEEIKDLRKEYDVTEYLKFCIGTRKSDGLKVFIKKYDKLSDWKHFKNEVETLKRINHQCIITINRAMYDERFYYVEMPFVTNGTLYDWLFKKMNTMHTFDSKNERTAFEVQRMMRLVIETIDYLHENDIIHRDLKMENIMMQNDTLPIIIDFDMSKDNQNSHRINLSTMKGGTLRYIDPQVQWGNASLNTKSDIYSFGVVLFKVFSKFPMKMEVNPMLNKDTPDLQASSLIIEDDDLIQLLKSCLHIEQDKRPTAHEILYNPFFMKHISNVKEEEQTEMSQSRIMAFKKYVMDKRTRSSTSIALNISIKEDTMLDDIPSEFIKACDNNTIYNRLFISFTGQQGFDAGALTTSFFRKFVQQLVDKKILEKGTSCFHICEDSALSESTVEKRKNLMLCFGIILAKCLYDQRSIGQVQLSNILIKFLLAKDTNSVHTSLLDFEQFDLRMSNDLNNLRFNDVSSLCLDFSNLKINGNQVEVTNENLNEYIALKVNQKMIESRKQNMTWIRQGFNKLVDLKEHFQMLHLNDYRILLTGEQRIDIEAIVNNCIAFLPEKTIKAHQLEQSKQWMLQTLLQFSQEEFKQFLLFCTGYSSTQSKDKIFENGNIHSGYARNQINIRVMQQWSSNKLPEAQVCFYLLNIPLYENKEQLQSKLKIAISNTSDFFAMA